MRVTTRYYALQDIGESAPSGLMRVVRSADELALEYLTASGRWQWDASLVRYIFLGELGAEAVSERQAADVAARLPGAGSA